MRGIAALLVVFFHIATMLNVDGGPRSNALGAFWARGFAGVDMFFVISGFIMVYVTSHLQPSLESARKFFTARLTRIYPLWWVFALLMMAYFMLAYGQPAPPDRVSADGVLPYVMKSLFLLPQETVPVLGLGWTLIHEMLFYLLFALGLLLPRKFLPIWLLVWAAIIAGASAYNMPPNHAGSFWLLFTSPLNLEFILGAFVAIWLTGDKGKSSGLFLWLGLLGFAIALMVHITGKPGVFLWKRVLVFGLPSAAMILGAVWLERQCKLKIPGFLSHLGDWSYSLYLAHFLVLLALRRIWQMADGALPEFLKFGADGYVDNVVFIILGVAGSIIAAAISYRLIEKPSLRLLRGKRN